MIHLLHGREIDRYFGGARDAGTIGAALGRVWRCTACRRRYERLLLFERVRPDAAGAGEARLWESIQSTAASAAAPPAPRSTRVGGAMLIAAVAGVLLFVGPRRHPAEPVARGPESAAAAPALHLYRNAGGHAEPVAGTVRASDGLLFAYTNPSDLPYLMVFGVDGKGGVHWYYPAYERLGDDPVAVPIRARAVGIELGEEIRHALPAGRMKVLALFLPEARRVLDVERAVATALARAGGDLDALRDVAGPGGVEISLPLEVLP